MKKRSRPIGRDRLFFLFQRRIPIPSVVILRLCCSASHPFVVVLPRSGRICVLGSADTPSGTPLYFVKICMTGIGSSVFAFFNSRLTCHICVSFKT